MTLLTAPQAPSNPSPDTTAAPALPGAAAAPADPGDAMAREWRALATGLHGQAQAMLQQFRRSGDAAVFEGLAHLRREFAIILAGLPDDTLAQAWAGPVQALHALLADDALRQMFPSDEDEPLLDALAAIDEPTAGVHAARLMMACNARWPVPEDPWAGTGGPLGDAVLDDRFRAVEVHHLPGDADRAARYLIDWTARVHAAVMACLGRRDQDRGLDLARRYALSANLIQTYFSELNLREVFRQRGELIALHFGHTGLPLLHARTPRWQAHASERIRVGVFAQQLGPGTENYFTCAHLEGLDRSRFELTLYTTSTMEHELTRRLSAAVDRVVTLPLRGMEPLLQAIRHDDLDLLLIGNNAAAVTSAATLVASARLAPLQVATVASPVTTGGTQVDVLLSAAWNEPAPDAQDHYTERLHRLEGSVNYYSYQHDTEPLTAPVDRASLGLATDDLVLFSGANFFKLVPEQTAVWVRILQRLPGAVLLLMPFNPHWASSYRRLPFLARLERQLAAAGLAPERIRVLDPVPTRADVQARVALADVYLDPFPFSGACSLVDPLSVAVPPVVRCGSVGRSRHGASLLQLAGLDELICADAEAYVQAAVRLGEDAAERARIRAHLQALRQAPDGAPWERTQAFAQRVGAELERLVLAQRSAWQRLAAEPADTRAARLQVEADRAVARRADLALLTDLQIVRAIVLPHFESLRDGQTRHLLDVGACYGGLSAPFLQAGWSADLFEPDPRAHEQASRSLAAHTGRFRLHAAAVSDRDLDSIHFHKAGTDGLSGLSASPFGRTEAELAVRCVRLDSFCRREGVGVTDFVKIDCEGHDFEALRSLDLKAQSPALVMVEYGVHFPQQGEAVVRQEIERMRCEGYDAVLFDCVDPDAQFKTGRWIQRLRRIVFCAVQAPDEIGFGNIVFYRREDRRFLLTMTAFLESCGAATDATH